MKKLVPWLPLFALCLAFGAERIQWRFHDTEILTIRRGETRLELGLRDDGVVVWREITNTTNSPAENLPVWFRVPEMTNILIHPFNTNLYWYQSSPLQTLTNMQFRPYTDAMPKQYTDVLN